MSSQQPESKDTEPPEIIELKGKLLAATQALRRKLEQKRDEWLEECFRQCLPKEVWDKQERAKLESTDADTRLRLLEEVQAFLHEEGFVISSDDQDSLYTLKHGDEVVSTFSMTFPPTSPQNVSQN